MKKHLFTTLLFFTLVFSDANAQYVTISDTAMVSWLTLYYPGAMVGNQMDTTNIDITSATEFSESTVDFSSLDGIQYFDNLNFLNIENGSVDNIVAFPPSLTAISLNVHNLVSLPTLPLGLVFLSCNDGQLSNLPTLPNSLQQLSCAVNNLSSIPSLPNGLTDFSCSSNNLTALPNLPSSLVFIDCDQNNLTSLPSLPASLIGLYCSFNNLTSLPNLPPFLETLFCYQNNLTSLPSLPGILYDLECYNNNLTSLPNLPPTLYILVCNNNSLTSLPNLNESLNYVFCAENNLTTLPMLPSTLRGLSCEANNLSCLPILPDTLDQLYIASTNISCLPNYPNNLVTIDVPGLPLCLADNANGCVTMGSISGSVFDNSAGLCINSGNLTTTTTFQLFDDQNNFLQSRSSSIDDQYYFSVQPGNYSVQIDSSFSTNSVALNCPPSGEYQVTALLDSSYTDLDFGFQCLGADLGVVVIVEEGIVFPGQPHSIKTFAGDVSNYFGLNCAAGTGGTVQLTVSGPVSYAGFPISALTPTVSGNTYSYTISDFSTIVISEAFALNFLTDTTAQSGDSITVTATISGNSSDMDPLNNTLTYTYYAVNSYDPNMKVVNPVNVLPGYNDYFTYTVHFQNLGTAPAFNIRIKDTLDSNLDLSSFRMVNASHNYSYTLSGGQLTVFFPNIMLEDSASNAEGSKGFIQYQVKPYANLRDGIIIQNTAHIFFDFNPAVVTNTTINAFLADLSLTENEHHQLLIYPNPSEGNITLVNERYGNESQTIQIFDLLGKKIVSESVNFTSGVAQLNLNVNAGTYMLVVENEMGMLSSSRLVVQK